MFDFEDFACKFQCDFTNFEAEIGLGNLEKRFEEYNVAGYVGWKFKLKKEETDDGIYLIPKFSLPVDSYYYSTFHIRIFMSPLNHPDRTNKRFKYTNRFNWNIQRVIKGKKMKLSKILDTRNGWLNEDGTFTYNIGLDVQSLMDERGIWKFNFLNYNFELKSYSDAVILCKRNGSRQFACHLQLLKLHCPKLAEKLTADNKFFGVPDFDSIRVTLNILHGVQLKYPYAYTYHLEKAESLGFSNVIRYIELQFIEDPEASEYVDDVVLFAIQSNFNRLLIRSLEKMENSSVLKEVVKKVDMGKMSGELMKICVMKLLYGME